MDDMQAQSSANPDEQDTSAPDSTLTPTVPMDEPNTDAPSDELQPHLTDPKGGTEGNEPPIATAMAEVAAETPTSVAEVSAADVAPDAAGETPTEPSWRPADENAANLQASDEAEAPTTVPASDEAEAPTTVPASDEAEAPTIVPASDEAEAPSEAQVGDEAGETPVEEQQGAVAIDEDAPEAQAAADEAPARDDATAPASSDKPQAAAPRASGNGETMEELLRMSEQRGFKALKYGDVIEGTIMRVSKDELLVDIGAKSEGIVPNNELQSLSPSELAAMQPGDEILVSVLQPEDNEGHAVLSLDRARQERSWRTLQKQFDANEIIITEVSGYNKGGLLVNLEGVRGFVPSSQVTGLGGSDQAKQADLQSMVGRSISLKIIEINRNRNRLILSERQAASVQREAMKERLLAELKAGDVRHGRVVSIADFGAFVDIGGADGLIHLSELSWSRVSHPSEVLKVGQEVDVHVLDVDENTRKIALSLKRTQQEPWSDITTRYQVGQLVQGTITQLATFGAFARIADGVEGLIHVSELSEGRVLHPRDVVKEGDQLTLRIIRIDPQRKRIGLSLKRAHEGASMADLTGEGEEGGQPRGERAPRPERTGAREGGREGGREAGAGRDTNAPRPERTDRGERGERSDRRGDRDRRPREEQVPSQRTYGGGGQNAMEMAMLEAMAQRDESTQSDDEDVTGQDFAATAPTTMPEATADTTAPTATMTEMAADTTPPAAEEATPTTSSAEVSGESFAASGASGEEMLSSLQAEESEEAVIADHLSTTAATEETGTGAETANQAGEDQTAQSFAATTDTATAEADTDTTSSEAAADEATTAKSTTSKATASDDNAELEWVHGIGPTYNKRLGEAGIRSNADLANANLEQLRAVGFEHESDDELNNWIQQAKDKLAA